MLREIKPVKELDAVFTAPPSKAHTLRGLFIASLANGKSIIKNALNADDQKTAANCLNALGAEIKFDEKDFLVKGTNGKPVSSGNVFAKDSGVTARFLIPLAGLAEGNTFIDGSVRLRERPIGDLLNALEKTGFKYESSGKKLPITVMGGSFEGGITSIKGSASSQFLSALLLSAPCTKKGINISIEGKLLSKPYIDVTLECMQVFGVKVTNVDYKEFSVRPQKYSPQDFLVEGDYSSASYFFAAAAITGGKVRVDNLNPNSKQGDKFFLNCLEKMGCKVFFGKNFVKVFGGKLKGITIDMGNYPDIVPTLAVVAAFAKGKTIITNVSHLALKESNRLESTAAELQKCGIKVNASSDSLEIIGGKSHGGEIDSHNDHRIAMSFSIMGLAVPGIKIKDFEVVGKSFENFYAELEKAYVAKPERIVLIGFRGTGKTSIGKKLAKRLNMDFFDSDKEIVKKTGKTISGIFAEKGAKGFRELEKHTISRLAKSKNACIACGGGAILLEENVENLKKNAIVILLECDAKTIFGRIRHNKNRPALTKKQGFDEILHLLDERKEKYESAMDLKVNTSKKTINECVQDIIDALDGKELI